MWLLFAIFFPLLVSPFFFGLQKYFPKKLGFIAALIALSSLLGIVSAGMSEGWTETEILSLPWVPTLGVNFTLITDGLSLFFGLLASAMGILVSWYAQFYMDPKDPHLGRFYACLMFFMGAMLGTVFSSNLILLFLFWEMTGVASFLLIGYGHPDMKAWTGARMALLTTAFTSLSLLAGIILLYIATGTFDWHSIASKDLTMGATAALMTPTIICFLIGIFGKSAQFPFYFWLPNAMVAPTPVSAYLHAATMVKLGVFLTARMYPIFVAYDIWFPMLTTFSFITMLLGAALSLVSNDLKAILAFATVSQLGFFLGFYGIGGEEGIEYDFVHILNHAFYKGSLFMLVGIVDHATGIRDLRRLGGLWNKLPLTTLIFFIATAAMAGIPGTTGFLSKELILTDIIALGKQHHSGWLILGTLIVASVFKVAFSIRIFYHLFVRDPQFKGAIHIQHAPGFCVHLPPLILSTTALIFGVWATGLDHLSSYFYVSGLHKADFRELQVWHGWTLEVFFSALILMAGALTFLAAEKRSWRLADRMEAFKPGRLFERFIEWLPKGCKWLQETFEPIRLSTQLSVMLTLFGVGFGIYSLLYLFELHRLQFVSTPLETITLLLIAASALLIPLFKAAVSKLLALSASGFFIALLFTLYKAPDLAMTQVLVEVATSLIILVLFRHIGTNLESKPFFNSSALFLSLLAGFSAMSITLFYQGANSGLSLFFLENSVKLAKGTNVVNTILIDFRGLDTLGESTVLIIALFGVLALFQGKQDYDFEEPKQKVPMNSVILRSILPIVFVLVNLFALFLLLRGHNFPGGGFIGGLATGISLIILGIAITLFKKTPPLLPIGLLGLGLIVVAGLIPLFAGAPFLTHFAEGAPPFTPLIFDAGVYFVVLAMTAKMYFLFRAAHFKGVRWS